MWTASRTSVALFAFFAIITVSVTPAAQALSVCPVSEYLVSFEPNSTAMRGEAEDTVAAVAARTRGCAEAVAVVVRAYGEDPQLTAIRAHAAYDALITALSPGSVRESHLRSCESAAERDRAIVTIFFLLPGLPDQEIDDSCERG